LGSGQAPLRHPGVTTYRCSLPGLAGFVGSRCTGPSLQRFPVRPVSQPRPSRGELGPAMADCGYRAPPAPRLARPPPLILPTPPPNGKLLSLRNLCKCGECALKNLNHISDPATSGTQNAGEPLAHKGGKLGGPGGRSPLAGARGVSPQSFKIGGELPTPGTPPTSGTQNVGEPLAHEGGKLGGPGGRSPLARGTGGAPPRVLK